MDVARPAVQRLDLSSRREDPALHRLLHLAAEPANRAALERLLDECAGLELLGHIEASGALLSLAAWRRRDQHCLQLEYLAVLPKAQHQGLASELVAHLRGTERANIVATTDDDAIDFYRARGFLVCPAPADPRWPQTARYLCTLPHPRLLASHPDCDPGFEYVHGRDQPGAVSLAEPDPGWPKDFEVLAAALRRALGSTALAVEHVGSTSVPGLPAKPLIDVCLLVPDAHREQDYAPALQATGILFWHREPGWYAHRMFKPAPGAGLTEANIHVFSLGSTEYCRMILYRDWLRTHSRDRERYARIKRAAATDINLRTGNTGLVMDYNRLKEPFILGLLEQIVRNS